MHFLSTDGLKELERKSLVESEKPENDINDLSYSVACFRRLHRLSKFNIISLEYLKESGISRFEDEFLQIKYPFSGLVVDFERSNLVNRLLKLINKFKDIYQEWKSEADLITYLIFDLVKILFSSDILKVMQEYGLEIVPNKKLHKLDMAVFIQEPEDSLNIPGVNFFKAPIVLVEVQKDPILPNHRHKDQMKIAVSMAKSLMSLIKACYHLGKVFCEQLTVQGLLIGCYVVEIVAMKAQLKPLDNGKIQVIMTFLSSKRFGRFSLFEIDDYKYDPIGAGPLYCDYQGAYETISGAMAFAAIAHNHEINTITDTPDDFSSIYEYSSDLDDDDIQAGSGTQDVLVSDRSSEISDRYKLRESNLNSISIITLKALEMVSLVAKKQSAMILEALFQSPPPPPQSDGNRFEYFYPDSLTEDVPSGDVSCKPTPNKRRQSFGSRSASTSSDESQHNLIDMNTIKLNDECDEVPKLKNPLFWLDDETQVNVVTVEKRHSPHEHQIYSLNQIQQSPFFAKLVNYKTVEGSRRVLVTTKALTCNLRDVRQHVDVKDVRSARWFGSSLLVGIMTALRTLHAVGYIHGDISPGNICYCSEERIWKLIDFDHSLTIHEASLPHRTPGTKGYVSPRTVTNGFFEPLDDYISLAMCLQKQGFNVGLRSLLSEICSANAINESWYERAIEIHKAACKYNSIIEDETLKRLNL